MFTRVCVKEQIPLDFDLYLKKKKNQQNSKVHIFNALTERFAFPICVLAGICIADSEFLCLFLSIPGTL